VDGEIEEEKEEGENEDGEAGSLTRAVRSDLLRRRRRACFCFCCCCCCCCCCCSCCSWSMWDASTGAYVYTAAGAPTARGTDMGSGVTAGVCSATLGDRRAELLGNEETARAVASLLCADSSSLSSVGS